MGFHVIEHRLAPVTVVLKHDIWAVAQNTACIHMGNCPSSWAIAQQPNFEADTYMACFTLGNYPKRNYPAPPAHFIAIISVPFGPACAAYLVFSARRQLASNDHMHGRGATRRLCHWSQWSRKSQHFRWIIRIALCSRTTWIYYRLDVKKMVKMQAYYK